MSRRWPASAAALLICLTTGVPGFLLVQRDGDVAAQQQPGPTMLALTQPAREPLRPIIEQTRTAPANLLTGRYVHTRQQIWSATAGPDTVAGVTYDVQEWRATADGSLRQVRVTLPAGQRVVPGSRWTPAPLPALSRRLKDFRPQERRLTIEHPSPLPAILAGQLHYSSGPGGATHDLKAVAELYQQHCLSPVQRAAALQVVADSEQVSFHGSVLDRAGRPGVAISATDEDQTRDLLIFDQQTGDLLSHERIVQVSPARSRVRASAVLAHVLYLGCEHTAERPEE